MGTGLCVCLAVCLGVGKGLLSSPCSLFLADGRFWWSSSGDTGKTLGPLAFVSPSLLVGVEWGGDEGSPSSPLVPGSQSEHVLSILLQPGKLTEAFKYFLQGMGYSKYTSTQNGLGTGTHYHVLGSPWVSISCVT